MILTNYRDFFHRYVEGKVFVALGNGDLVVYCRDIGKHLMLDWLKFTNFILLRFIAL